MLFHIAKEDCSGGPVVSDAAVTVKRDECGVCGGTGDTCVDCQANQIQRYRSLSCRPYLLLVRVLIQQL